MIFTGITNYLVFQARKSPFQIAWCFHDHGNPKNI